MLKSPGLLSDEEMLRINAFLILTTDFLARECHLKERGIFVECDNATQDVIKRYFGNPYAQVWWKIGDTRPEVNLPVWVDEAVENTLLNAQLEVLEELRKELRGDTSHKVEVTIFSRSDEVPEVKL